MIRQDIGAEMESQGGYTGKLHVGGLEVTYWIASDETDAEIRNVRWINEPLSLEHQTPSIKSIAANIAIRVAVDALNDADIKLHDFISGRRSDDEDFSLL